MDQFRSSSTYRYETEKLSAPLWKQVKLWILLIPIFFSMNGGSLGSDTGAGTSHQILLLVSSVLGLGLALRSRGRVMTSCARSKIVCFLPMFALLSAAWSVDARQSLISAVTLICFTLFCEYVAIEFSPEQRLELLTTAGALAALGSVGVVVLWPSVGLLGGTWRGIFLHKQQCAGGMLLFLITGLYHRPVSALGRLLRPVYLLLCLLVLVFSQSRTGWLATVLVLALATGLRLMRRFAARDALVLSFISVPLLGLLLTLLFASRDLLLASIGKDPTLSQRTIIWSAAWVEILRRPWLGYGYEAFWRGLQGESWRIRLIAGWELGQAQSGYLDLWLQLGVLGLVILTLMLLQAGFHVSRQFRQAANPLITDWAICVLFFNLIYNISETDFGYLHLGWLFFVIACLSLRDQTIVSASTYGGSDLPMPQQHAGPLAHV